MIIIDGIDKARFYRGDEFSGDEDPRYSDREFIIEQLGKAPFNARVKLLAKYSNAFDGIMSDESIHVVRRANIARLECNTRLRTAISNLTTTHQPTHTLYQP